MTFTNRFKAHILFFMLMTCSVSTVISQEESPQAHKHTGEKRKRKATKKRWLAALGIGMGIVLLGKYGWHNPPSDLKNPASPDDEKESNPEVHTPQTTMHRSPPEDIPTHEIKVPTDHPAQIQPNEHKQDTLTTCTASQALEQAIQTNDTKVVYKVLSDYKVSDKETADSLIYYLRTRKKRMSKSSIPFNRKIADALYSKSHQAYFRKRVTKLVTDICLTTRDNAMMDWVQSKIGDAKMENIASHLLYQLAHKTIDDGKYPYWSRTETQNAYIALRFIGTFNPNPFKPYDKKGSCAIDGKYLDTIAKGASQYLLDNYANPELEKKLQESDLVILPHEVVKIVTSYVVNDICEPGALHYIIRLLENRTTGYCENDITAFILRVLENKTTGYCENNIQALRPRFAYYKDEKKQNLLHYAFKLTPSRYVSRYVYSNKERILKTLLLSGVDYTDCQGDDAESIVSILDQLSYQDLKYIHQPLLYATYRAGQTLYASGEEETEEGKNDCKYLTIIKGLLQDTMSTAHDKNNLSVFDYAGGNITVLKVLITGQVHPNMQDSKGTIFHKLTLGKQMPQFIQYMENKRKPSRPHMSYDSALALIQDHPNLIDPRIRNRDGKTALDLLRSQQNIPMKVQDTHKKIINLLTVREEEIAAQS